jgi:hypothetical protein
LTFPENPKKPPQTRKNTPHPYPNWEPGILTFSTFPGKPEKLKKTLKKPKKTLKKPRKLKKTLKKPKKTLKKPKKTLKNKKYRKKPLSRGTPPGILSQRPR